MNRILDRAVEELTILGLDETSEKYKCLVAFSKYCQDQASEAVGAAEIRVAIHRLLEGMPLSPLTGSEEEWETVGGVTRNKRCNRIVKEGDVFYDLKGIVFYEVDAEGKVVEHITENSKVQIEFPYNVKTIYKQLGE